MRFSFLQTSFPLQQPQRNAKIQEDHCIARTSVSGRRLRPNFRNLTPQSQPVLSISGGAAPVQHRLAYHGSTGMRISWSTYEQLESPTVQFGLSPHTLFFHKSSGSQASTTYPTSRTWNNHVTLEALLPNTKYFYKVSNSKSDQIYSFKTPKIRGDRTVSC